uniref:SURP motif domain-containing protein n=1 Tax=Paramoeba aestuarina TaxID=180227 RepID=A0A7S4PL91_9EUKA
MTEPNKRIIIPAPSLVDTIHKTAQRVAEKGLSFENGLRSNPTIQANVSFNFLKDENPYHPYYLQKIEEYRKSLSIKYLNAPRDLGDEGTSLVEKVPSDVLMSKLFPTKLIGSDGIPSETLFPRLFSLGLFETLQRRLIPKFELRVIMLTAQYFAVYGELSNLNDNPYFLFLHEKHPWHKLFRKLCLVYTAIWQKPGDLASTIRSRYCQPIEELIKNFRQEVSFQISREKSLFEQVEREKADETLALRDLNWDHFEVVDALDLF